MSWNISGSFGSVALRQSNLGPRFSILEIAVIKMPGQSKVRFSGIWFQTQRRLNCGARPKRGEPRPIVAEKIKIVVHRSELAVGKEKFRIALHCLIEQI